MKAITAELVTEKSKRDRQGRRITPPARRAELEAGYRASGLTMEQFARREDPRRPVRAHAGELETGVGSSRESQWAPLRHLARAQRGISIGPIKHQTKAPGRTLTRGAGGFEILAVVHGLDFQ